MVFIFGNFRIQYIAFVTVFIILETILTKSCCFIKEAFCPKHPAILAHNCCELHVRITFSFKILLFHYKTRITLFIFLNRNLMYLYIYGIFRNLLEWWWDVFVLYFFNYLGCKALHLVILNEVDFLFHLLVTHSISYAIRIYVRYPPFQKHLLKFLNVIIIR